MIALFIMDPIIAQARSEGGLSLTEIESNQLLASVVIIYNLTELAKSEADAISLSKKLGYLVALKIASPDLVHKNDKDGITLGLESPKKVKKPTVVLEESIIA